MCCFYVIGEKGLDEIVKVIEQLCGRVSVPAVVRARLDQIVMSYVCLSPVLNLARALCSEI